MRGGREREVPIRFRQLMVGLTWLLVLVATVLAIKTWPTSTQTGPGAAQTMSVRVVRSQPCTAGSFEEALGRAGGLECQEILVEVLNGVDSGQLVALDPLFVPSSRAAASEGPRALVGGTFKANEVIQARVLADEFGTTYSYVERTRTVGLFLLVGSAMAAVLVAGYWFGARAVAITLGSVAVLVLYAVPALNQPNGDQAFAGVIAVVTAVMILALILVMDGATKLHNQMVFLASILTTLVIIGIGQAFLAVTRIGDPVSAASLVLNPSGTGASQQGFVLLGTVIASIVLVHWIATRQVASVMTEASLQSTGTDQKTTASLFFDCIGSSQRQTANGISLFVLASLSASLPLLGLFANNSLTTGTALNNEMVAATLVRVCAGVLGLVLASPIATGLAALTIGSLAPVFTANRGGEVLAPRPPMRREHSGSNESVGPAGPGRLRVGLDDL